MELKPKIGIDNLSFGMTRKELVDILGKPDRTITNEEDENEFSLEWNNKRIRLTFYKDENERFGYLKTSNPELRYLGNKIIGTEIERVKKNILSDLRTEWEIEDYDFFINHFYEDYWLTLQVEYGVVTELEMGVPFKNDEDYDWPE